MRTFSLGAGKDTVVFAATAAANGEDTITGFKAGTGADADVLNFTATGVTKGNPDVDSSDGTSLDSGSGIGVVAVADKDGLTFVASSGSATSVGKVNLAKKGDYIIITDVDGDGQAGNIYFVTAGESNATSDKITITLLGTVMREGDTGAYDATNFA